MSWARQQHAALPALLAMGVLVVASTSEGGYPPTTWYPAGILLIGLLVVAYVVAPPVEPPPRSVLVALCCFAAYAAWAYLSIIWAAQAADAWDGANRVALYGVVFALFAVWRPTYAGALLVVGTLACAVVVIGVVELLRVASVDGYGGFFFEGRLSEPTGYANANAALWTLGLIPSAFLAACRDVPVWLRAFFLAGAVVLIGMSLLVASRGWLFAAPLAAIVLVVLLRERLSLVVVLAVLAGATAVIAAPAAAVYADATNASEADALIDDAATAILVTASVALIVGLVLAAWHRRVRIPPAADKVALAAVAVAVATGAAAWAIAGDPAGTVSDAWEEFRGGGTAQFGDARFSGGFASDRYDMWRVAWDAFERHPARGIGADNFLHEYLRDGETTERARYPHSFELGVISQTGLVGAALLCAALGAALIAAAGAIRRRGREAAAAAAALTVFAYWLAHASIDWLWEFPGVAGPALACLGLAGALAPRDGRAVRARRHRWSALLALPAVVLVGSFIPPWAAHVETREAAEEWVDDGDRALERIDRAAAWNPLASEPRMVGGVIAIRLGRLDTAEEEFQEAVEREPGVAYGWLQLGAIASVRGDFGLARERIAEAAELSPRDELIRSALRAVKRGKRVSPASISARELTHVRARTE